VSLAALAVSLCFAATGLWGGCKTSERDSAAARQPKDPAADAVARDLLVGRLQAQLDAFRQKTGCPGATAAFVLADGPRGAAATGVSHKSSATPMRAGDRMLSGSIGKTYVAAVTLQLVEEGRVKLDTPVSHWLGDRDWYARVPNADSITLRMLMNHTSGVPEHVQMPVFHEALAARPDKTWKPEELVAFVLDRPPVFAAGEGWSYADTNYIFVGMIVEQVTGRTYYEELRRRILEPYGLQDTIPSDRPELPGLISGYTFSGNPFPVSEEVAADERYGVNPQFEWTGGGLLGTSLDLARWARLLYAGDVLEPSSRTQMLQGVPAPRLGRNEQYGLGVIMRDSPLGPVYGHAGWFPGYVSMVAYYPRHDLALAIQVNTDFGESVRELKPFLDTAAAALLAP
jgi:D-alanyl-D-alanine carboxypeptidase